MPYKSDAQRKKFHAMSERGEISKKTVEEFDAASKGMDLPERVKPKKLASPKSIESLRKLYKEKYGPKT